MKTRTEIREQFAIDDVRDSQVGSDWQTHHDLMMQGLLREVACQLADVNEVLRQIRDLLTRRSRY